LAIDPTHGIDKPGAAKRVERVCSPNPQAAWIGMDDEAERVRWRC
jgi:hypothetical protein